MSGPASTARSRLITTSAGTNLDAFGTREWGLLAAIASIWGSSFLFMEIGLDAFHPTVVTMARVGLGAATLALVPRARRPVDAEDRLRIAFLGLIWIAIPLTLFPVAQQWIDSALAGMLNGGMPIATAAIATLMLRRLPPARQVAGIVIGFLGIVLISLPGLRGAEATALGTGLVLIAIVLYGLAANVAVPLQQRYGALPVLLRAQLAALVVVVPAGLFGLPYSSWDTASAIAMVPLGTLGTGLAFVAMTVLVGRVGGPRGSVAIYFVPIVAIVLGIVFRDEAVAVISLVGTAVVIAGAWLTSRREVPAPTHVADAGARTSG
ncbi:MAG: DMT family transporter [Actinobacteria bacterium]|nr:DMT family transporter [Actinomycetota bacterium]